MEIRILSGAPVAIVVRHGYAGGMYRPIPFYADQPSEQADRSIASDVLEHSFSDGRMLGFPDLHRIATKSREAAEVRMRAAVEEAFKAGWDRCWCRDEDAPTAVDGGREAAWRDFQRSMNVKDN